MVAGNGEIRVGTAGWAIDRREAGRFGPGSSALSRYATRLGVVEINSSFHRPHRRDTYARWAASVPGDFRFWVKLPRAISHDARLQRVGPALDAFADQVAGLGAALGGVLVQLPPSLGFDARVAGSFLGMLRRRLPVPIACEPRHPDWLSPSRDAWWRRQGIARVMADPAVGVASPIAATASGPPLYYLRLHGTPRMYYSAYATPWLQALATSLVASASAGASVVCIFDNTAHGHALGNALELRALCSA